MGPGRIRWASSRLGRRPPPRWLGSARVRILIFHGYLLEGTGSNVYNARLVRALVELGHEVHLLCQDRHPERYAFLDAAGSWEHGRLSVRALPGRRLADARATLYRPDIGSLLPVYVADRYEGVQARTFAECSDAQVAAYVDANVAAVREVVARARPEIALANHLVMGPVILARALARRSLRRQGARKRARVHGQARARAVSWLCPRGPGAGARGARRLTSHRREPVGGDRRCVAAAAHPLRPARR